MSEIIGCYFFLLVISVELSKTGVEHLLIIYSVPGRLSAKESKVNHRESKKLQCNRGKQTHK